MRPFKQIVGHRMKPMVEKEVGGVGQSPLLKVTDCCCTFAGKKTEEHYSWCLWCRERERKREKEGERDGKTRGGGRGGGSCQSVSIFTRRSH